MFEVMDRGAYEKLSIRDSARSLKKYGSTSKHINRNENFIKHHVSNTDTLQGIALKYDITIEQIRRANRLWASDSLFLKEFLLIPIPENNKKNTEGTPVVSPSSVTSPQSNNSFDDDNIQDFLEKIDASIATTKKEVKKVQKNSEFATNSENYLEKRKGAVSRMKKTVNNNGTNDLLPPHTVVVHQGKRVQSSLLHHERQQEELFEL